MTFGRRVGLRLDEVHGAEAERPLDLLAVIDVCVVRETQLTYLALAGVLRLFFAAVLGPDTVRTCGTHAGVRKERRRPLPGRDYADAVGRRLTRSSEAREDIFALHHMVQRVDTAVHAAFDERLRWLCELRSVSLVAHGDVVRDAFCAGNLQLLVVHREALMCCFAGLKFGRAHGGQRLLQEALIGAEFAAVAFTRGLTELRDDTDCVAGAT